MPTGTKALLLHLNVYLANNNVKSNAGSFVSNIQSSDAAAKTTSVGVLAAGGTYNYSPGAGNKMVVINTDVPLTADVSFAGGGGFTKEMKELMVLDIEVASIVFTNNDADEVANLVIISG